MDNKVVGDGVWPLPTVLGVCTEREACKELEADWIVIEFIGEVTSCLSFSVDGVGRRIRKLLLVLVTNILSWYLLTAAVGK